jgi:hypothetical protein
VDLEVGSSALLNLIFTLPVRSIIAGEPGPEKPAGITLKLFV